MKRYNSVYDGVYTKPNEMVEEANGDWVRWEDVEKLEALNAELLEALEGMLQGFLVTQSISDYPIDAPCNKAAAAIAKAKGESNE